MKIKALLSSLLALAFVQSSHAVVLAYDGLSGYTEGDNIWGQTVGGSGFTGTWQSKGTEAGPATVASGGLTYTSGGATLLVSGDQQVNQFNVHGYTRAELATPITVGTTYLSALAMAPDTSSAVAWGPLITVNVENQNPEIDIPRDGLVHLVVFKIDLDASAYTIWLDPTPGTSETANAGQIVGSYNPSHPTITSLTHVVARGGWDMSFDELRVGTTFGDVTPAVPEPSGMILLGLGSFALLLRRNRR